MLAPNFIYSSGFVSIQSKGYARQSYLSGLAEEDFSAKRHVVKQSTITD